MTAPISAAFSPFITGPLLLALFNGPDRIRQPLLDVLKDYAPTAITTLKYLFAIGLTSRINSFLNRLSLNRWHLTKPGAPWTFSTSGGRGEIILITGGCSGFGLTMTQLFTKRAPNAKLVIIDRSPLPSELSSTPNLSYYNVDLTDTSALMATTETIKKEVGDVTVLINNAGIGLPIKHILEIDLKQVEKVFGVNTFSQIPLIQAFLPAMLKAKKGHIVTFASMASFVYVAGVSDCTSRFALPFYPLPHSSTNNPRLRIKSRNKHLPRNTDLRTLRSPFHLSKRPLHQHLNRPSHLGRYWTDSAAKWNSALDERIRHHHDERRSSRTRGRSSTRGTKWTYLLPKEYGMGCLCEAVAGVGTGIVEVAGEVGEEYELG